MGQRLRVLDVGMGQGTQALRLARAGHSVTGLESDAAMLTAARESLATEPEGIRERVRLIEGDGRDTGVHFLPGSFDVVLCHGVLMYVEEPDPMLAGLARMLAPGGLLSLLVRNADALAMRPGLAGDFGAALAAFDTATYTNRLGLTVRADRLGRAAGHARGDRRAAARLVRRAGLHGQRGGRDGAAGRGAGAGPVPGGPGRADRPLPGCGGAAASVRRARLTRASVRRARLTRTSRAWARSAHQFGHPDGAGPRLRIWTYPPPAAGRAGCCFPCPRPSAPSPWRAAAPVRVRRLPPPKPVRPVRRRGR
ncbi:methyltransferase domain-containing protein [Streptomyces sp. S1A(2023)]